MRTSLADALPIAKNVLGNVILEDVVETATDNIIKGHNFADPPADSGQFSTSGSNDRCWRTYR